MERFRAAVVQYAVEPMAVEENLRRGHDMVGRCVRECGARLLVLPESCTTGFSVPQGARPLWETVDPIPGKLTDAETRIKQRIERVKHRRAHSRFTADQPVAGFQLAVPVPGRHTVFQ